MKLVVNKKFMGNLSQQCVNDYHETQITQFIISAYSMCCLCCNYVQL